MSSRRNSSRPEIPTESTKNDTPPGAEALTVSPALAALFTAHGVTGIPPRQPDEFTVAEYAAFRRMTTSYANAELLRMTRAGKVTRRMLFRQYVYRFVAGGGTQAP